MFFLNLLKKLVFKFSFPLSFSYLTGFLPFHMQLECPVPLERILDYLKRIPFLKSILSHRKPRKLRLKRREARILDFWRAIEYFSVKQIPEVSPPCKNNAPPSVEQVFDYYPDDTLPWEKNHRISLLPKKEGHFLRFKIFGGVYSDRLIDEILEEKCGKDETYETDLGPSEKLKEGDTCAYFFMVTDDGRPLFDSFSLPTCAWALGRTLTPGPHHPEWFTDFDEFEMQAKQSFKEHFAIESDDIASQELQQFNVGRIIKSDRLIAFTEKMAASLGLQEVLEKLAIRFQSIQIKNKDLPGNGRYEVQSTDFLNSFFLEDLKKISTRLDGQYGTARCGLGLKRFLMEEKSLPLHNRTDTRHNRMQLLETLEPSRFPIGCWPSKGHHPLATSQQFAVNEIMDLNHKGGILTVNGPPGTGKTTLLRDLMSAIVVERAKVLQGLAKPSDAFNATESWKSTNGYDRKVSLWKPEFKGFETVVASSNNGAIENVTLEIPGREAVDASWLAEIDYFTNLASFILKQPAWGLVGARLGNKENRYVFRTMFWYGKKPEEKKTASSQSVSPDLFSSHSVVVPFEKPGPVPQQGFNDLLKTLSSQSVDWKAAVIQFEKALQAEAEKRTEAEKIYALFQKAARLSPKPKMVPNFLAAWKPLAKLFGYFQRHQKEKLEALYRQLSPRVEGLSLTKWLEEEATQELSIPWLTPAWFEARARVFIEALKLHKAFITANAKIIQQNLWGAIDILQETVPLGTPPQAISAAWSTLFFVIPVISTTFASFGRLFCHMGEEDLGWLLIDEAGQALPQAAVGAIWRSKRIVVVGDPMQLKPVITLSLAAQKKLQQHFQTETTWIPRQTSVQELADRVCLKGTSIQRENQSQPKWVGMPLRVHRRCEENEFNLSNTISYGNMMIFGTPPRTALSLPKSRWLNVPETSQNQEHWIPEEGELAKRLILRLMEEGISPHSIFIISPFRAVVGGLELALRNVHKQLNIGTIHTTQGKEADVVILVLGGNPEKPGAKKWASQEPNLLNVAVTRAKRRFYIIGNQGEWEKYPYFREASHLYTPPPSHTDKDDFHKFAFLGL